MNYIIIIVLVGFSAIFSGLTIGFFSLNKEDLKRKANLGNKEAIKVYKIRKNGNLLLCTLLIGNVAVNSVLSIFLGSITSGIFAGFIATGLIVIFGEIIPQATFSHYALMLGAKFSWLVKFFIFILYPICVPMAFILDKALGEEIPTIYSKKELTKIIEEHEDSKDSDLDENEERILKGALSFSDKNVENIMTPRTEMFSLSYNKKITKKTIKEISDSGHSRIPVYKKDNDHIIAILYVKDLINNDWHNKKIKDIARSSVLFVNFDKKLDDLLDKFKETRHHIFIVLNKFGGVSGLVTIEDVIEEIIGAEIIDEFDKYENLQEVAKKKMNKIKRI